MKVRGKVLQPDIPFIQEIVATIFDINFSAILTIACDIVVLLR